MSIDKATDIPMSDCGLSINCGSDGTWLHFTASGGKHASLNVEAMGRDSVIGAALRAWCADRQRQAEEIRAATGGVS